MTERLMRFVSGRIALKCLANDWRTFLVNDEPLRAVVIQISKWGRPWKLTASNFLAQASLGILRKRIYIVFAESKFVMEHELPLRGILKPSAREFEQTESFRIE